MTCIEQITFRAPVATRLSYVVSLCNNDSHACLLNVKRGPGDLYGSKDLVFPTLFSKHANTMLVQRQVSCGGNNGSGTSMKLTREALRHANSRITLELYAQSRMAAKLETQRVPLRDMVGTWGLEPQTSTVSR
jgi:hypothetical protein